MNKKFFTLIASAFTLVASLGTANAQSFGIGDGYYPINMDTTRQKGVFQLAVIRQGDGGVSGMPASDYTNVLSLDKNGHLYAYPKSSFEGELGQSLWCIAVNSEEQGANPRFDFTNYSVGMELAASVEDVSSGEYINVGYGSEKGWRFSSIYETGLNQGQILYTYFKPDSVLILTLPAGSNKVGVIKRKADPSGYYSGDDILRVGVWNPAPIRLTASDYNTLLQTQQTDSIKLKFNPDRNNTQVINPWTDLALRATTSNVSGGADIYRLTFEKQVEEGNKARFLRVDTAWVNEFGNKFHAFAFGDTAKSIIRNQYDFYIDYYIGQDSLDIYVAEARYRLDYWSGNTAKSWLTESYTYTYPAYYDMLRVKLQDLSTVDKSRIVTIGSGAVNTKISFGRGSCAEPADNIVSLENNLYTIKRTTSTGETQYLVVPIYTDTIAPKWVTLDLSVVDPNYIPAYQWVIEKTRASNPDKSPVRITNREFGAGHKVNLPSVVITLTSDGKGQKLYGESVTDKGFKEVTEAQRNDAYLGYKDISSDESKLSTYDFNYLHKLNASKYLGQSSKDSSLIVKDGKTQYHIIPQGNGFVKYGYYPSWAKDKKIAQLQRQSYIIKDRNNKAVMVDNEHRYAVGKENSHKSAVFFLKTNNTVKDGSTITHYYALLDTGSFSKTSNRYNVDKTYGDVKMGVADETLWTYEQVQKETRTSAFAINIYTAPLYRRFDGVGHYYGQKHIEEPYGEDNNAPVWLQFVRTNNYPNEVLFENAANKNDYRQEVKDTTISFLGYYNRVQYPEIKDSTRRYTFYVDTAFVQRQATGKKASKPEEYTAKPQYMLAVRPHIVKGDTTWCQDPHHHGQTHDDPEWINCPHTIKTVDMVVADYLFNAQDSIGTTDGDGKNVVSKIHNKDYVGKSGYGAENVTRLAFVRGVHAQDTFYVLRGKNPYWPKDQVVDIDKLRKIDAADKIYLGDNDHYEPRWNQGLSSANMLKENAKSMVFQFRLFNSQEDRSFLIESRTDDIQMGPDQGRWLQWLNGVPVISEIIDFNEAARRGADIFDVVKGDEDMAVGNENNPTVSAVQVIGETGAVTILNAAKKTVAITNILGQTIANQTISSDNATISLPKGIVVVAVEGETAVKAIVK